MAPRAWARRVGGVVLAVLVGMASANVAEALWSRRVPLSGTLSAGNLVLRVGGPVDATVDVGDLAPNLTTTRDVHVPLTVRNAGTTALDYRLFTTSASGAGTSGVQLGLGVSSSATACQTGTSYTEALAVGALAGRSYAGPLFVELAGSSTQPPGPTEQVVCVRLRLPALTDPSFAPGNGSIGLAFAAEQSI